MKNDLDEQMGEIIRQVTREVPFSNAPAAWRARGLALPGNVGGDCAHQVLKLIEGLSGIPGEARIHRAVSVTGTAGRSAKPGAHVLVIKETAEGQKAMDPYYLHVGPFSLARGADTIQSVLVGMHNRPTFINFLQEDDLLQVAAPQVATGSATRSAYRFHTLPEDQVTVTGLENANKLFPDYSIRFVFEQGVGHLVYDYGQSDEILWSEGGGRERRTIKVDGLNQQSFRREVDLRLEEFDLDLGTVIPFLKTTPRLVR